MELLIVVLSGFAMAGAVPLIHRWMGSRSLWLEALVPAGLTLHFLTRFPDAAGGAVWTETHSWVPSLGVDLAFRLDGLSLVFGLLITLVGTFILIYAAAYLEGEPERVRVQALLLAFMAAMLGLVLADDLLSLFVFWEITSILSYLLIGTAHEEKSTREAALQALLVTGTGGLALLGGLLLLGHVGGSWSLAALAQEGGSIQASSLYPAIVALVLLGALTKSAQFPFHVWLPSAMAAPTPVSAYLHSATMVKAGVYLLLRVTPILGGPWVWELPLLVAGGTTMLVGGYLALRQTDLKRVLAYSTVSILGTLVLLTGIGTTGAIKGALVLLVAHALYKAALFMVAGAIDHETGTRDLDTLRGLRRAMPVTAAVAGVAALSVAGLGPLLSFVGKELVFEALLGAGTARLLLLAVGSLTAMLMVAVAGLVGLQPFIGQPGPTPHTPHEPRLGLLSGPLVLAGLGLVLGVASPLFGTWFISPAAGAVLGAPTAAKLVLWHGVTPALLMSLLSLAGGVVIYFEWASLHKVHRRLDRLEALGPARWYDLALGGLRRLAAWVAGRIQAGSLLAYTATALLTVPVLVGGVLLARAGLDHLPLTGTTVVFEAPVALLIAGAGLLVATTGSRLTSVIALGVVGYAIALAFILFGAPDLAMTQFLFETLSALLFLAVLTRLPEYRTRASVRGRASAALLAVAVGATVTVLLLGATQVAPSTPASAFYGSQSYLLGHGRNVVNVILVDFRALDTLGEVVVLGVAGLGVYALLRRRGEGNT